MAVTEVAAPVDGSCTDPSTFSGDRASMRKVGGATTLVTGPRSTDTAGCGTPTRTGGPQ